MINLGNSEKAQTAMQLFKDGYNCSQAVVGAWCDELDIDFDTAMLLSSGFGGGMGRLREVCGTCTGAFMVLSLKLGSKNPKDAANKKKLYETIQKFASRFKEENRFDSIVCRELLGLPNGKSEPTPAKRTDEYYKKRPCVELVGLSAELLNEFI